MSDITLIYRPHGRIEDLGENECTMHRASGSSAARWWQLWFRVKRDTDGQLEDFCVPVNPGGGWLEAGPGGKTWGLTRASSAPASAWFVAPSINVLGSRDAHAGDHMPRHEPSIWHHTPMIVGVPPDESWIRETP